MRDSDRLFIGFLVIAIGWILQTANLIIANSVASSALPGNTRGIIQLVGAACIVAGLLILAFGFRRFARRVEGYVVSLPK